ncbi:MAG: quinolinate synthase NadA [Planctomycetes bacterium]|nr:quinolinate synthase NadA [Planctomycetota bacterium]
MGRRAATVQSSIRADPSRNLPLLQPSSVDDGGPQTEPREAGALALAPVPVKTSATLEATLPDDYALAPEEDLLARAARARRSLGDDALVLAHHYQCDEVVAFADATGDSFKLARHAARSRSPFIVFCGVHFMAETADILTRPDQAVILPDLAAGCSMADMAHVRQVEDCWEALREAGGGATVPITYMNSSAAIKAFCGRHGGAVCTSSNARRLIEWALGRGERVLFLPDQHLGRNTAHAMGHPLESMVVWDPALSMGGLTPGALRAARFVLWKGHCSVHTRFTLEDVHRFRAAHPEGRVLVHPECTFDVVQAADCWGSTEYIRRVLDEAEPGSTWAIGTEIHLTNRLASEHPDKSVRSLSPVMCLCATMYRIDPPHLCWALESLVRGEVVHRVSVPTEVAAEAVVALERMLEIA